MASKELQDPIKDLEAKMCPITKNRCIRSCICFVAKMVNVPSGKEPRVYCNNYSITGRIAE